MNHVQGRGNKGEGRWLVLLDSPVRCADSEQRTDDGGVVRDGTTGRVVFVVPGRVVPAPVVKGKLLMLPRVWAVAETEDAAARLQPLPPFDDDDVDGRLEDLPAFGDDDVAGRLQPLPPFGEAAFTDAGLVGDAELDDEEEVFADPEEPEEELPVELAFYRRYTEGMLRRYVRLSLAAGRVPSLLGRELFRGHVSSYRMTNFEDVVVFCFDMEKLLGRMRAMDKQLIKRIGMQEYPQAEVASMLRISARHCIRNYNEAIDRLTEMLLEARMLEPLGG